MYILIKTTPEKDGELLIISKTIFLRPTPWKVAWLAGFAYVLLRPIFKFAYLPREFQTANYSFYTEEFGKRLVVKDGNKEVYAAPVFPLSFRRWIIYGVESWVYGLMTAFWNWRWDSGTLTKKELQDKLERLERKLEERTRRIPADEYPDAYETDADDDDR